MSNTVNIENVNRKIQTQTNEYILSSERYYHKQLSKIINKIKDDQSIKFILLAGPSSAGKTTTGNLLVEYLNNVKRRCKLISLDDFFLNRDETPLLPTGEKDFDSIYSIDWKLFNEKINELLNNKKALLPVYDFVEGIKKYPEIETTLDDSEILIFEGLHALNPIVDKYLPKSSRVKIFLNPETSYVSGNSVIISNIELRLVRRLIRDQYKRHTMPEVTIDTWKNVRICEEDYIFPYKDSADFIINTSLFYEAGVYSFILKHMKFKDEYLNNIKNCFLNISDINPLLIPDGSLLYEFIVKGETYTKPPILDKKTTK